MFLDKSQRNISKYRIHNNKALTLTVFVMSCNGCTVVVIPLNKLLVPYFLGTTLAYGKLLDINNLKLHSRTLSLW